RRRRDERSGTYEPAAPAASGPRGRALFLRDDVGDPGRIRLAGLGLVELAARLAVVVLALPVDAHLRVAGLVEQLADLRHRPDAPFVREGFLELGAVRELEMDVAKHPVRDRIELGLVPDIREVLVFRLFLLHGERLGAAEDVEHEEPVVVQRVPRAPEVLTELLARLEAVVAEVESADDVDRIGLDGQHVAVQQLYAGAILLRQPPDAVRAPPLQRILVDVDADRGALLARPHPFARGARRAAEVLAEADRLAPPQLLEGVDEVFDLAVDGLHGLLVELVDIGLLRHRQDGLSLRGGHRGIDPLQRLVGAAIVAVSLARCRARRTARSSRTGAAALDELRGEIAQCVERRAIVFRSRPITERAA